MPCNGVIGRVVIAGDKIVIHRELEITVENGDVKVLFKCPRRDGTVPTKGVVNTMDGDANLGGNLLGLQAGCL